MFIIVALTMIGYGVMHSWLASTNAKQLIRHWMGERKYYGLYRVIYNLIAIVSLAPVIGLVLFRPGTVIWQITGASQFLLLIIQLVGLAGVIISLTQINLGQFIGLTQASAYFQAKQLPLPKEALQYTGLYRLVRHPLYTFSLLTIWPMSTMTEAWLAFNILVTVYFIVGSKFEEQKLVLTYGDEYRDYQQRIPSLIPFSNILRER